MLNYCDCGDYCQWCRPDLCRDARINPAVGDRLRVKEDAMSAGNWREVTQLHEDGLTWIGNLRECGQLHTCTLRTWRRWATKAIVERMGLT